MNNRMRRGDPQSLSITYTAFGAIHDQTGPTITTLFAFTARPFDTDTGLQNNLNRRYDAETGRWTSEDPSGFTVADANLYRYVENAPVDSIDPSGLWSFWRWIYLHGRPQYCRQTDD